MSKQLIGARYRCFIEHQCINYVMYADDIRLLAPSALLVDLKKLLDVCSNFSRCNDIVFNSYLVQLFFFAFR